MVEDIAYRPETDNDKSGGFAKKLPIFNALAPKAKISP